MPTRDNDKRPEAGMPERTLAFCVLHEHKTWQGNTEIERATENAIIDYRAHGLAERAVISEARRYVADWFATGATPKPYGNAAVRALAHVADEYPLTTRARLVSILTAQGLTARAADNAISDAVRQGLVAERRGRFGKEYRLTNEPRTLAVRDLAERVAGMIPKHPGGVPFRLLRHVACRIVCGGLGRGAALIERSLNAGLLRAEVRGEGLRRERYVFPNFKNHRKG